MASFYRNHPAVYRILVVIYSITAVFVEIGSNILNNLGWFKTRRVAKLPASLEGKVAVVTGANAGIGRVTAENLLKLDAKVILGCRDMAKAERVVEEIVAELPEEKRSNVILLELNLSSFESVRAFAKKVQEKVSKVDLLINNAGVMMCPYWKSTDGYEMQFATNHLGHFLLTNLLINKLKSAPSARVVNVSAASYRGGSIDFDDINLERGYSPLSAYNRSKLANIFFTQTLARRLQGSNVTTYVLHPGIIKTELGRHMPAFVKFLSARQINAFYGAQTTLYCALEEGLEKYSGDYFANCARKSCILPHATDEEEAQKLWKVSLKLCKIKDQV